MNDMHNVTLYDNGACFMIQVDGLQVKACSSLGEAWHHIVWMHREDMTKAGYLD